jgi:hypothetical protein
MAWVGPLVVPGCLEVGQDGDGAASEGLPGLVQFGQCRGDALAHGVDDGL